MGVMVRLDCIVKWKTDDGKAETTNEIRSNSIVLLYISFINS